jgi:hypothetical protein
MSNKKTQIIRPEDGKEYISYQFETLKDSLRNFDYIGMAEIVEAAHHVFMDSSIPQHQTADTILLDFDKLK